MLKRFLFCLTLLCALLCAACASAEPTFDPADFALADLTLPGGLKFVSGPAYDEKEGILSFTVDSAATDWASVILSGYSAESNEVKYSFVLRNPHTDDPSFKAITSSTASDEYLQDRVSRSDWGHNDNSGDFLLSNALGLYDKDKQLFIPHEPEEADYSVLVGWKNGTDIKRLRIKPRFSDYSPQSAAITLLPAENILLSEGASTDPTADFSQSVSAGNIRYTRKTPSSDAFITRFTMPTIEGETQSNWDVRCSTATITDEGPGVYSIESLPGSSSSSVKVATYTLEHRDALGNLRAVYSLTVSAAQGDIKPWPAYLVGENDDSFGPAPLSRMRVFLSHDVPGVSASYDDETGHLSLSVDGERFVPAAKGDLASVRMRYDLTPPADAKYMRFLGAGGEVIFGNLQSSRPETNPFMPTESIEWDVFEEGFEIFREVPYKNGAESYFTSPLEYTGEYSGRINFYFWYTENPNNPDAQPFRVDYVARTFAPVSFVTTTPIIENESELPAGDIGKPFIVIQDKNNSSSNANLHEFHATMYPTGENRHYYELKLLNNNGKEAHLDRSSCRLYLPYPPGYDETNAHLLSFTICHYNKPGSAVRDRYSIELGNLAITPYGLCITVRDFSPFTLEWAEPSADAAADLPQTGDASRPLLWALLLALCACALCLRRTRRA